MIGFCTGLAASGHIVGNPYLTGLGKSRRREAQAPDFINNECGWVGVIFYLFRRYTLSARIALATLVILLVYKFAVIRW